MTVTWWFRGGGKAASVGIALIALTLSQGPVRATQVCTDFDGDRVADNCIEIDDDVPDDKDDLPEDVHFPGEAPPEVPPVEGAPVESE